ncbi:MAG TPA: hypothetical protein C5S50_09480 [Methanosarcinaceae archaeon]|nr:hypothetical protein [Methanosarcinaceae archaeon]
MTTEIENIKEILGDNLVSLAEYQTGNDATHLAVCRDLDFETLQKLKHLGEIPLLLTKEELVDGADVFPIEFLNIKQHHTILYGEDFMKDIHISKEHLRHQLEFEIRSKLIHLRGEYLQYKNKDIESLILAAVPTLTPLLGALLYLKNLQESPDMFSAVSDGYSVDTHILKDIYDIRRGNAEFREDRDQYIRSIIKVLSDIGEIVDEHEVNE